MNQQVMRRAVRVNLALSSQEKTWLEETLAKYAEAYSLHIGYYNAMQHTSKVRAQDIYEAGLALVPLPSALFQTARDHAAENLKAYHSRFPKRKWTKTPEYRARSARYDVRTVSLRGSLLSFSTTGKRVKTVISLPEWFTERYPAAKFKAASIGIDKKGQAYAQLAFVTGLAPVTKTRGKTIGIDRGIKNVIFTSEGASVTGSEVRRRRRQHLHTRRTLQQKGTRAARKRLAQQSGREKRFMQQVNHEVSKWLASREDVATYVLEDLSFSKKDGSRKEKWKRKSNKRLSDWAHGQLLAFLSYKAEESGIELVFVDPSFTSQDCSRCKHRSRLNRSGERFKCAKCGYVAHADLNAAVNIRDKYLSSTSARAGQRELPGLEIDLWAEKLSAGAGKSELGDERSVY